MRSCCEGSSWEHKPGTPRRAVYVREFIRLNLLLRFCHDEGVNCVQSQTDLRAYLKTERSGFSIGGTAVKNLHHTRIVTLILALFVVAVLCIPAPNAQAAPEGLVYTVVNTNDSGPGSLRQAILDANANVGADVIKFNIPGTGAHTIKPASALPTITDPVTINAYSQPGAAPNTLTYGTNAKLLIVVNGVNAGTNVPGLIVSSGSTTIKGLVIYNFMPAISLNTLGGNTITGNFIGTNYLGTAPKTPAQIQGIWVGSNNNVIGGTTPATRNLISGNTYGIIINSGMGNIVEGNLIGTDATGTKVLTGQDTAIKVYSNKNMIGGTTGTTPTAGCTGACNLIAGSESWGINISGANAVGTAVYGNYIGSDVTGLRVLGNSTGIVTGQTSYVYIGDGTTAGRNVIVGGHFYNIMISQSDHITVAGNYLGVGANGTVNLGGYYGVGIYGNSHDIMIGGTAAGTGNRIGYATRGVAVDTSVTVSILRNSIFSSLHQGIDLGNDDTVAINDPGDGDTGANNLQNYPVLTAATSSTKVVKGTLNSTLGSTFHLEFFANPTCNATGYGEGQKFLGGTFVTTDSSGNASFSLTLGKAFQAGQFITATATDAAGTTTEFSKCKKAN